jgi:acylphosphatase
VGFRYRARHSAQALGITGFVRNKYDGTVELEVQGERELIDRMLAEVGAGSFIYIDSIEQTSMPVDEDERSFSVRH